MAADRAQDRLHQSHDLIATATDIIVDGKEPVAAVSRTGAIDPLLPLSIPPPTSAMPP
jgi:hypothetical protein